MLIVCMTIMTVKHAVSADLTRTHKPSPKLLNTVTATLLPCFCDCSTVTMFFVIVKLV